MQLARVPVKALLAASEQEGYRGLAALGLFILFAAAIAATFFYISLWLITLNWQLAVASIVLTMRYFYRKVVQ